MVGEANVLTDAEDLYVYSFERLFMKRQYPKLDAVLKVTGNKQAKQVKEQVMELASKEDIEVFRRSTSSKPLHARHALTILIDNVPAPQLDSFLEDEKRKLHRAEFEKEICRAEPGTYRNLGLALKSLFSDLPAQKCLNCKVCSGYCAVATCFNGVETWSSKGRALLTRAFSGGELQPSPKLIDILYSCSLCGLCFAQCFESTQVRKAIMDARHRLAEKNQTPELFTAAAKNILEVGDPSGMPPSKRTAWTEHLPQKGVLPKKAEVLYWAGCIVSTRTPNAARAMGNVLTRAKVDFTFLGEKEGCCGYVLLAAGLWKEAMENAVKLVARVKETEAKTLVTPCAGCYYTFTRLYPEILGVELSCKVLHSSQYVESIIKERKIIPHSLNWGITYHDPCSLGRHCGVYDSPRNVLKAVPNLDLVEMPLNRNRARCCGAGGGLWSFNNSVAMNSALEKLVKDVAPSGVSTLVTACPTCNINFRSVSVKKGMGIRVYDLMEIVDLATAASPSA